LNSFQRVQGPLNTRKSSRASLSWAYHSELWVGYAGWRFVGILFDWNRYTLLIFTNVFSQEYRSVMGTRPCLTCLGSVFHPGYRFSRGERKPVSLCRNGPAWQAIQSFLSWGPLFGTHFCVMNPGKTAPIICGLQREGLGKTTSSCWA
jgi:hypothetical protein